MMTGQSLAAGIYVPIPNFFLDNEDVDYATLEKHIAYLANTGISGIIFQGSTGEAVHLTEDERVAIIKKGKELIMKYDPSIQVLAGTGAGSARLTVKLTRDAADAGAAYALVLPPSYYKGNMDNQAFYEFYTQVADQSPIPIIIYNYPGVTQGLDIDAPTLARLAKHDNIVGIKGTDGNIGKVGYLTEHTREQNFTLLAGSADFFLPALSVGAVGCVPGLANVMPRSCVELLRLYQNGDYKAAKELQLKLVLPDDALARWFGLPGVKAGLEQFAGYGGRCRTPLRSVTNEQKEKIIQAVSPAFTIEQSLRK
ncbi:uncharacterized protein BX664DRAFT_293625 [Halteromyces radiatus]|uniref:uncharacterized protein n=1 Tax=Halteromyces radiatus TaxID=101107 RepID=UPI00221E8A0D|nr:uncharacterized protein BX664DRAFT_293625 [Halteromyces radiatus]KAI8092522.1 hypothetical protein BX664DRAFT_293625 [Halteromyces radiatus]